MEEEQVAPPAVAAVAADAVPAEPAAPPADALAPKHKVFVGGLHWDTTDEGFMEYFQSFGETVDCILVRKPDGKSRGFGFVTYAQKTDMDALLEKKGTIELDGRELDVKLAVPKEELQKRERNNPDQVRRTCKIFIGGLHMDVTNDDLDAHFSRYGAITDRTVMTNRSTGRSRRFGFVTFEKEESVDLAMADQHTIKDKAVEVKKAVPPEKNNKQRQQRNGRWNGMNYGRGGRGGYPNFGGYGNGGYAGGYGGGYGGGYRDDFRRGYDDQRGPPQAWHGRGGPRFGHFPDPAYAGGYGNDQGFARGDQNQGFGGYQNHNDQQGYAMAGAGGNGGSFSPPQQSQQAGGQQQQQVQSQQQGFASYGYGQQSQPQAGQQSQGGQNFNGYAAYAAIAEPSGNGRPRAAAYNQPYQR